MNTPDFYSFLLLFIGPLLCSLLSLRRCKSHTYFMLCTTGALIHVFLCGYFAWKVYKYGPISFLNSFFRLDPLSTYNMILVSMTFSIASLFTSSYFNTSNNKSHTYLSQRQLSRFSFLWNTFLISLQLIFVSNSRGMVWFAVEATTLVSAFLILLQGDKASIEAMWKYLLICSVGIAFGLMSIILFNVAATKSQLHDSLLLLNMLHEHATTLDPKLIRIAFIFAVVGFGTKAGIVPMHTWLPDAHSQAPTPVSAVFSGVMITAALYCVIRFTSIATACLNTNHAQNLLMLFGFLSMGLATLFICLQNDIKRLLAYSSIEHIGILCIGIGCGGSALPIVFFHMTVHTFTKVLAFFSAGKIIASYGTRTFNTIQGAAAAVPFWGKLFFITLLILGGSVPFPLFITKIGIFSQLFSERGIGLAIVYVSFSSIVFIVFLKKGLKVCFGMNCTPVMEHITSRNLDRIIGSIIITCLVVLGFWFPTHYKHILSSICQCVDLSIKK